MTWLFVYIIGLVGAWTLAETYRKWDGRGFNLPIWIDFTLVFGVILWPVSPIVALLVGVVYAAYLFVQWGSTKLLEYLKKPKEVRP